MGKGYAEGPAAEAAEEQRERLRAGAEPARRGTRRRRAVLGQTAERPVRHFLGWADEVDADALFARGQAWGIVLMDLADDASSSTPA
jgi:hypothetical protein